MTCHEDVLQQHTYIYSFEPRQSPGQFSLQLRDTLGRFFDIAADGDIDGCPVQDGVIFNHFDTSFEAWLVRTGARWVFAVKRRQPRIWISEFWPTAP